MFPTQNFAFSGLVLGIARRVPAIISHLYGEAEDIPVEPPNVPGPSPQEPIPRLGIGQLEGPKWYMNPRPDVRAPPLKFEP